MRKIWGILLMAGMMLAQGPSGLAQAAARAQATAGGDAGGDHAATQGAAAAPDTRSEKQKALAMQAERLVTMATELKAQVDLTNKNILSLKVVQKAEEIEALAKGMRVQAKK